MTPLLFLMVVVVWQGGEAANLKVQLGRRVNAVSGRTCRSGEQRFSTVTGSLLECFMYCVEWAGCKGAFYRAGDGECRGCSRFYTGTAGLPSRSGTVFMGKGAKWGEASDSDTECMFPRMQRKDSVCKCNAGWPYSSRTKACVMNCGPYGGWGTSYEAWPNHMIDISQNVDFETRFSPNNCFGVCNAIGNCYGFDFGPILLFCAYKGTNAATTPQWYRYYGGRTHYTRNCV